jgi:NitT/TauT family transport system substrate-binding protein
MSMKFVKGLIVVAVVLAICAAVPEVRAEALPTFSLAWSEYPSWSAFGVAHEVKLINGKKGKLGPIEKKWGVDIVLKEAEYDPCLMMYGAGQVDAVCITNMDVLPPSLGIQSVAILPTSTSYGADACIVTSGITAARQLRGRKVYGLAKTVSEYCFVRNLEIQGESEKDHVFTNMDPGAAAMAMQQRQKGYDAVVVWNPFVLSTLNKRKDTHVLFDSTTIPGEIIDMVVASQKSLDKPGGKAFACAVIDAFYTLNRRMADPATRDDTLIALGEKFSHLDLQSMRKVVQQTKFYSGPEMALSLFAQCNSFPGDEVKGDQVLKDIMVTVVDFCVAHEIVGEKPVIGYGSKSAAPAAALRFDPGYILEVMKSK